LAAIGLTQRRWWRGFAVCSLVVGAVAGPTVGALAAVPHAAGTPPTTLPVPAATVDPRTAIGGERLASMGLIDDLPAGVPAPPALRDVAWVLADLDTGDIIAARAPHARLRPASTLKTLTALTLIPQLASTRTITAAPEDASADGTRVGIVPGLPYTAGTLFDALLMSSGNDAAYALARAAGGKEATVAAMNARAAYLGAHDTVAKDPSGLDAPGQTSSAYDLALIGRAAMQLSDFRTYVTTKQVAFPGRLDPKTKRRATYIINNHNRLLYNYPGTIGIKNGYTEAADHTFVSAVHRGTKTYLLTEMDGRDGSWRPQAAMYDWAFRYGALARPVGVLVAPGTVTAASSTDPSTAPAGAGLGGAGLGGAGLDSMAGHAAAAAVPPALLLSRTAAPWVGLAGLAAAVLLVALLAARAVGRGRRHQPRH
jgi:serine-type D-Ala-D-Ala carboxypeptidase (penicillin-binding protein 5/6)